MAKRYVPDSNKIKEEILKCGRDPIYFIINYAKIVHPIKGLIPFKLYKYQEQLVKDFNNYRFNVILKARQLGVSTLVASYIAWMILFFRSKQIVVVATKQKTAANIVRKVKTVLKKLPKWLVVSDVAIDNVTTIELDNGSWVMATSTSSDAARSESLSLLILDEAAHIPGLDDMWAAVYPTLSCIAGDSLVLLDDGFKKIENIIGLDKNIGDYFEIEKNIWGKGGIEKVSHGYVSPESETLIIKTRHGMKLEVTKKHPLYKLFGDGGHMETANNLQVGDFLRIDVGMQQFGNVDNVDNIKIDNDFSYLLGGWIAEGWITNNCKKDTTIWISNEDKEFREIYLKNNVIKPFREVKNNIKLFCCSNDLINIFKKIGVNSGWKCDTKEIPEKVFQFNKELLFSFLQGLFDGDGSCTNRGVVLSSTSYKLLQQVQLLLLNIGIISSIFIQKKREEDIGKRIMPSGQILKSLKDSWALCIPLSQLTLYQKYIGFRIQRKKDKLELLIRKKEQDDRKNYIIPTNIVEEEIKNIIFKFKSARYIRENGLRTDRVLYKKTKKRNINNKWIENLIKLIKDNNIELNERQKRLLSELNGSWFWDDIVSIEKSNNKTYDFTVPKTHSFLQNGIIGSNTGGRCIALSTPKGSGNWFHKTYTEGESGKNDFHPTKLIWDVHPERDDDWFAQETRNLTRRFIAQEYECVTGETKIITKSGYKIIKNIIAGDEVLTHRGRFRKVSNVFKRKEKKENMRKINTPLNRGEDINITHNHPIFSLEKKNKNTYSILESLDKELNESWLSADEIKNECSKYSHPQILNGIFPKLRIEQFSNKVEKIDLSSFPICYEKDDGNVRYYNQWGWTKRFVDVDYKMGKFIGLFLSEGCFVGDSKKIQLSFHKKEDNLLNFIIEICEEYNLKYHLDIRNYSKCNVIYIVNKFFVCLIKEFVIGSKSYNKYLRNEIYQTNKDFIRGIIDGVWMGDGYHSPNKKNVLLLTSERLIYQIRTLMSSFGLITRLFEKKPQCINYRIQYGLELNNVFGKLIDECTRDGLEEVKQSRCKSVNGIWWGRIKIKENDLLCKDIDVYNLEVEEDNSYVCGNLIVHNCSFLMSGETVFHPEDIERINLNLKEPKYRTGIDRNLWLWEEYKEDCTYFISADVARGDGLDYSVFHIFKLNTMEIIGEYQGKIAPDMFAEVLMNVGKEYGNCMIIVENNSIGYMVLSKMIEYEYENIYYSIKSTNEYIDQIEAEYMSTAVPGFTTTVKTRPMVVAKMEEFIRNKIITINSVRMVNEMRTFIWNNGKPEAMRTYNDDLIMACAIGCFVRDTILEKGLKDSEYRKAFLESFQGVRTHLDTSMPNMDIYKDNRTNYNKKQKEQDPLDYIWVIKG